MAIDVIMSCLIAVPLDFNIELLTMNLKHERDSSIVTFHIDISTSPILELPRSNNTVRTWPYAVRLR
jgi:hypothetical protein